MGCVGPPVARAAVGDAGAARQRGCGRRLVTGVVRQAGAGPRRRHQRGRWVRPLPAEGPGTTWRQAAGPGCECRCPRPARGERGGRRSARGAGGQRTVQPGPAAHGEGVRAAGAAAGRAGPGRGQRELPARPSPFCLGRSKGRGGQALGERAGKLPSRGFGVVRVKCFSQSCLFSFLLNQKRARSVCVFSWGTTKTSHLRLVRDSGKNPSC